VDLRQIFSYRVLRAMMWVEGEQIMRQEGVKVEE
jgi:hypothetical protein